MGGFPDLRLKHLRQRGPKPPSSEPSRPSDDAADYAPDEDEFVRAVAHFRSVNNVGCPTMCQLLWVLKQLGYRKTFSGGTRVPMSKISPVEKDGTSPAPGKEGARGCAIPQDSAWQPEER